MTRERQTAAGGRIPLVAVVLFGLCGFAANADFADGLEAYDGGDWAAVLAAWRPLAEAGDAEAQTALGGLYLTGTGVAVNPAEAARWYRLAAEQGDPVAQLNLGDLYSRGSGVGRDLVQAYLWLSLAAAQGRRWPERRRQEFLPAMTAAELAEAKRLIKAWQARR